MRNTNHKDIHLYVPFRAVRTLLFYLILLLSILLHAAHDSGDHPNGVQQLAVHVGPVPDPPQLGQHSGQFVPQGLIHPGIALHYHVPAQEPLGDVVLLRQAREPHSGVDLLVFLRGYPEGHGLVPPAVVSVQILS